MAHIKIYMVRSLIRTLYIFIMLGVGWMQGFSSKPNAGRSVERGVTDAADVFFQAAEAYDHQPLLLCKERP